MNLDKLNQWLTLGANIGVLVGIIVVAIQLQQTQIQMKAESSNFRTVMARENNQAVLTYNMPEISSKLANGEELSELERQQGLAFFRIQLRYLENLHYQHQIGALEVEIWEAQLNQIERFCNGDNSVFSYLYPNGLTSDTYRHSFRQLFNPPCGE